MPASYAAAFLADPPVERHPDSDSALAGMPVSTLAGHLSLRITQIEESLGAIDEADAVARSRDGDLDACAVLVARYTLRAHRAAWLLGAGEDADDVMQEAFVKSSS